MEIISHRGYWTLPQEKNTPEAFRRSFSLGFGTETDVRDHGGELVISHDPPTGNEITLNALLDIAFPSSPLLALNIKADGLAAKVRELMISRNYPRWFTFDMSIPDTRAQLNVRNPVYMRASEFERDPPFLDQATGIWLDAFETDNWRIDMARRYIDRGLSVCLVSPELHMRNHLPFWDEIASSDIASSDALILCTDFPEDAAKHFSEIEK